VSKGFASVFKDAAQFDLTRWGNDLDDGAPEQPGATADTAVYVGSLSHMDALFRGKHECVYVMVAPNSNTIGNVVRSKLESIENLLAPTRWAQGVLRAAFPDKKVLCVPHGVDPAFTRKIPNNKSDYFSVLHLSSSILERKGTDKLLEGWKLAGLPNARLYVSVPPGRKHSFEEETHRLSIYETALITDRLNYKASRMAALYSNMDYVCQPSRGEGFGLVPLEARACGTPVIATDCTGHSEHVRGPGTVIVKTGGETPIDDFPGAFAPSLSAEDVAEALTNAYQKRSLYSSDALRVSAEVKKHWSWENQLKEFKNVVS
jgi:glycosyltransferase involved in cell wall biosynthesis